MNRDPNSIVETDLQLLEKLYESGDNAGAIMIARRLLIAHTLSPDDKRRIKKVIDGTKPGFFTKGTLLFALVLFIFLYICLRYA